MATKKPPYGESYIKQSTYKAKCEAWQNTIGELTEKNKALFDANVQLESDVDQLRTKLTEMHIENGKLKADYENLKSKYAEDERVYQLTKNQLTSARAEVSSLHLVIKNITKVMAGRD